MQFINPVNGDVSDSELNAMGGKFRHPPEINEGVPWDPMLQKNISEPIQHSPWEEGYKSLVLYKRILDHKDLYQVK